MVETGNWVTPLEDYGVPFWAKPPLSTWLTAICFKLFGVSEFTARLSSLVLQAPFGEVLYPGQGDRGRRADRCSLSEERYLGLLCRPLRKHHRPAEVDA
jgi:hypothetical protein